MWNELNSATAPIAWSQKSDNQAEARAGQRKNSDHLEKRTKRQAGKTQSSVHLKQSWTAQALFAWTRTHDEPGKSETFGYIAAGLLCADVSFTHCALAQIWDVGAKALHGNNRLFDACFRVFARSAKKKIFNSFTSFSRWKWFILYLVLYRLLLHLTSSQTKTWTKRP